MKNGMQLFVELRIDFLDLQSFMDFGLVLSVSLSTDVKRIYVAILYSYRH